MCKNLNLLVLGLAVGADAEVKVEELLPSSGLIGVPTEQRRNINYEPRHSTGGCHWERRALFCRGVCPAGYDTIRWSNSFFKKAYCCSRRTWQGHWMEANHGHNFHCIYRAEGRCGKLTCYANNPQLEGIWTGRIRGESCDQIRLFGRRGLAGCGIIRWVDDDGNKVDAWYKSR